jgi:hypothetical protein
MAKPRKAMHAAKAPIAAEPSNPAPSASNRARPFLAPTLPKTLPVPAALLSGGSILEAFGLSPQQCIRLETEVFQWKDNLPHFEGVPRNAKLPAPPQNLEHGSFYQTPDLSEYGIFQFYARVTFSAPDAAIIRDFRAWVKEQRALLGFSHWAKLARNRQGFDRDLIVYALAATRKWSANQIEVQLAYLGLPALTRSPRTDAKAALRKIRFDIGRLLAAFKRSELSPEF